MQVKSLHLPMVCPAVYHMDSAVLLTGRIDAREEEAPKVLLNEAQPLNEGAVNALTTAEKPAASVFSDAEAAKRAPHKLYIRLDSLKGVKWPGIRAVLSTSFHFSDEIISLE